MVPGHALGLVLGRALDGARHVAVAHQRLEAESHRLLQGHLLVLDVAVLLVVLITLLLLLRVVVRLVGDVAALLVAVLALNDFIVLGLFHGHHLE